MNDSYVYDVRAAVQAEGQAEELAIEPAETRLDAALQHIKKLDKDINDLYQLRDSYMKQLAQALKELQQKCDVGSNVLSPSPTLKPPDPPHGYPPEMLA